MAEERIRLDVQERSSRGSRETRRLRRSGLVPGVLYGKTLAPRAICVPERELRRVLTGGHGLHAILDVVVDGDSKAHASILKAYQQHPVRGNLQHIDLQEVPLDQPIQSAVTVHLEGDAPGVRAGGVITQVLRELTVEALPMEMPDEFVLDVSGLEIGDTLRVADVPALRGATIVDDPETVVATLTTPTPVAEPEEMLDEAEAAEGRLAEQQPEGGSEAPPETGADAATDSEGTAAD